MKLQTTHLGEKECLTVGRDKTNASGKKDQETMIRPLSIQNVGCMVDGVLVALNHKT